MSDDQTGFVTVGAIGTIPTSLPKLVKGGTTGTVDEHGHVIIDELDGTHLRLRDQEAIEVGTDVYVVQKDGKTRCKPLVEHEAEKQRREHERARKEREQRRQQKATRRDALAFWDSYDIPFEYETAIKGRISGLRRGSDGSGTAKDTVVHLHVLEDFEDGRLWREADSYLCTPRDSPEFQFSEHRHAVDGKQYMPKVTCSTCLDRMERWKVTDE